MEIDISLEHLRSKVSVDRLLDGHTITQSMRKVGDGVNEWDGMVKGNGSEEAAEEYGSGM